MSSKQIGSSATDEHLETLSIASTPYKRSPIRQRRRLREVFLGAHLDENGEYPPVTADQAAQLDVQLERLAAILSGCPVPWLMGGAINISLYGDAYVRNHKDIDLIIFEDGVEGLQRHLNRKGYAIFRSVPVKDEEFLERFDPTTTPPIDAPLAIARIASRRVAVDDASVPPPEIDLYVRRRRGNEILVDWLIGTRLPDSLYRPVEKQLRTGGVLNMLQPVVMGYIKLRGTREHDAKDFEKLSPYLSPEDIELLGEVLSTEIHKLRLLLTGILKELWLQLAGITSHSDAIVRIEAFAATHPALSLTKHDPGLEMFLKAMVASLAEYWTIASPATLDEFLKGGLAILQPTTHMEDRLRLLSHYQAQWKATTAPANNSEMK